MQTIIPTPKASAAACLTLCGFVLGIGGTSCLLQDRRIPNGDHCANHSGDGWCRAKYGEEPLPYCVLGTCGPTQGHDGCVFDGLPSAECYSPCGDSMTVDEDATCLEGSSSSSGGTAGTETGATGGSSSDGGSESSTGTTGDGPCTNDEDCTDPAAPFCDPAGACVDCSELPSGNEVCAAADPERPVCDAGVCVACTGDDIGACEGETPICDAETNTCVPCTEHDQCGEAACNLFTGACLPMGAVVHVGAGQTFSSIGAAVNSFAAGAEGTIIVHAGDYNNQAVTVDGGRVLALLAEQIGGGAQPPRWTQGAGGSPQLTVGDATVLLDGIQVSGNASSAVPGVLVDGGRVWLDRSRVVTNLGGGIVAQGGAELVLRNCFVGGDVSDVTSVEIDASTATVLYTTVGAGFGAATAMTCGGGSTVDVRNSIFVARTDADEVQCTATIERSAAEQDLGGTNEPLGAMSTTWFSGYATGDFHLGAPPAVVGTTARWQVGDPPVDVDGDARPNTDGATDFAGADVP